MITFPFYKGDEYFLANSREILHNGSNKFRLIGHFLQLWGGNLHLFVFSGWKCVDGAIPFIYPHKYNTNSAEDSSDMLCTLFIHLNITPSQQKIYPIRAAYVSQYEALQYMRADSETNFRKITKKCSKKIFRGNSKEAPINQIKSIDVMMASSLIWKSTSDLFRQMKWWHIEISKISHDQWRSEGNWRPGANLNFAPPP